TARGDYDRAREVLGEVDGRASGTDAVHVDIEKARALMRLGLIDEAAAALDAATAAIDRLNDVGSLPLLYQTKGELAYQLGRLADARAFFAQASELWVDDLPEAASVEARAYLGFVDHLLGRGGQSVAIVAAALEQAMAMRRVALEGR